LEYRAFSSSSFPTHNHRTQSNPSLTVESRKSTIFYACQTLVLREHEYYKRFEASEGHLE
jgi:hypothetical protein